MACHRASGRGDLSPLATRTSCQRRIACRRSATGRKFRYPLAGGTQILASARTAPPRLSSSSSAFPAASAADTGRARARWVVGGKQLSRNSSGSVWETSRPRSRLEISRSARPYHPAGPNRLSSHARRLPRIAASAISEEIGVLPGVSKIDPLIFGIPLRGPSPSLSPSTRH